MKKSISSTKKNHIEEAPFCTPGASTETENDLRVKLTVESKIGFPLEID